VSFDIINIARQHSNPSRPYIQGAFKHLPGFRIAPIGAQKHGESVHAIQQVSQSATDAPVYRGRLSLHDERWLRTI
jgi:hypothetical protein